MHNNKYMIGPINIRSPFNASLCDIKKTITIFKNFSVKHLGMVEKNSLYYLHFFKKECENHNIKAIYGLALSLKLNFEHELIIYPISDLGLKQIYALSSVLAVKNKLDFEDINELKKACKNGVLVVEYQNEEALLDLKNHQLSFLISTNDLNYQNNAHKCIYNPKIEHLNCDEEVFEVYNTLKKDNKNYQRYDFDIFNQSHQYIENINVLASACDIRFTLKATLPIIHDSYNKLKTLCYKSLENKNLYLTNYLKRLEYELEIISKLNFVDYFLLMYEIVEYCGLNDILLGPGRGSAAGSLIAYLLDIIRVDPLRYDLMFERFLNPYRLRYPDIDIDIGKSDRNELISHLKNKYGKSNIAIPFVCNYYKTKNTIDEVGKILNISSFTLNQIKQVFEHQEIDDDYLKNDLLSKLCTNDYKIKKLLSITLEIINMPDTITSHVSGIVLTSKPIINYCAVLENKNTLICQVEKEHLEDLGLIKYDLLSSNNIDLIKSVVSKIKKIDPSFDLYKLDINNKKIYDEFNLLNVKEVFQMSSNSAKKIISKIKPKCFNDLVLINSLNRPGPDIDKFIVNRENNITTPITSLKEILDETNGVIIYQEQVIRIIQKMTGFNYDVIDIYNSAIKHKDASVLDKLYNGFKNAALCNNYSKDDIDYIFEMFRKYCGYGFNKAHGVSYSYLSFYCMYLKTFFPALFFSSVFKHSNDVGNYYDELMHFNIELKTDINISTNKFISNNKIIMLPLCEKLGSECINNIIEEKEKKPFQNYFDCLLRLGKIKVSKEQFEILILCGYFDSFGYTKATMLENINEYIAALKVVSYKDIFVEEIKEYSNDYLISKQKQYLGFTFINPLKEFAYKYNINLVSIKEISKKEFKTIVELKNIKRIKDRNNKDMAFLKICDIACVNYEVVVFNENYAKLSELENDILVNIKVFKSNKGSELILSDISKI